MIRPVGNNREGERERVSSAAQAKVQCNRNKIFLIYTYCRSYRDCKQIIDVFAGVIVS